MTRAWPIVDDLDVPPPLDEYGASGGHDRRAQPTPVLALTSASSLAGLPVPARSWLVPDLIPDRAVTLLGGDGGVGKSLAALQLGVAVATASDWIGQLPQTGPVVYLSAEDDIDELHRRLVDIVAAHGLDLADVVDLHIAPLAGLDAILAAPDGRGLIVPTPLWNGVLAQIRIIRPRLLIVDNAADAFAGSENARAEVRQFVGLLRAAAVEFDLAVVLLAHPSLTGLANGSGLSGSTAWNASVRARLFLDRARGEDGEEPDPALRVLQVKKSNYAAIGTDIRLRWEAGRFRLEGGGARGFDRIAEEQRAERIFLDVLGKLRREGREVSHKRGPSFAPVIIAKHPDANRTSKIALEAAMNRLFAAQTIVGETYGPPSKGYSRIVLNEPKS